MIDHDIIVQSARVKALEKTFLTRQQLEKVAAAPTLQAALGELDSTPYRFGQALASPADICLFFDSVRANLMAQAKELLPVRLYQWYRFRYDIGTLRLIFNAGVESLLPKGSPFTLVSEGNLGLALKEKKVIREPEVWQILSRRVISAQGPAAAAESYQEFFRLWVNLVANWKSEFLSRYQSLEIDFFNLSLFLQKEETGMALERKNLVAGGQVNPGIYLEPSRLWKAFPTYYSGISPPVTSQTWEKEKVKTAMRLLREARRVAAGVEVLVAYLLAREIEITGLQKLLLGKAAGLPPEMLGEWIY
ncbi:MAG: V-type ATPase subunit, partial [Candidatus Omnitrophica bacterium]|nr:V-type ATPase subunit [Candidatus Omnitrophota bacterium]